MADEQLEEGKKPEPAAPPMLYERGTWLHERDGDLNPTWIWVSIYLGAGLIAVLVAVFSHKPTIQGIAFGFLSTVIVALLISALPVNKAKVLARANLPAGRRSGLYEAPGGFGEPSDELPQAEGEGS